jgi:hypothetical protein
MVYLCAPAGGFKGFASELDLRDGEHQGAVSVLPAASCCALTPVPD